MSFQGKLNIYTCEKCHKHIVTIDRDEGVTPFSTSCYSTPGCLGRMFSSMYRVYDQTMLPDFEWYRPESLVELKPHIVEHVKMGGLILRPYGLGDKPKSSSVVSLEQSRQVRRAAEREEHKRRLHRKEEDGA